MNDANLGQSPPSSADPIGRPTVLIVDDEESWRGLVRYYLGYRWNVLEAGHGEEALELCGKSAGRIHLLITDIMMPVMNGWELSLRLSALYPDMKTLFITGNWGDPPPVGEGEGPDREILRKPFSRDVLLAKVANLVPGAGVAPPPGGDS